MNKKIKEKIINYLEKKIPISVISKELKIDRKNILIFYKNYKYGTNLKYGEKNVKNN